MKKKLIVAAFASVVVGSASAQTTPEPPKPPKAQVGKTADIPPPPPPAPEPPLPPKPPSKHIIAVVPPPPPSEPPPPTEPPSPPTPPVILEEGVPGFEDYKAFLKRNPSVKSLGWTESEVIIKLKSGKQERYSLDDQKSIKDAEAKYGILPEAPPAPPPPPPVPSKLKRTLS